MRLTLPIFSIAAAVLALGTTASAAETHGCGPNTLLCIQGYLPQCGPTGNWTCAKPQASSSSSSSAATSRPRACGPNGLRCMSGTAPQCIDGDWYCVRTASSSSADRCVARCPDGYEYRTCTENGHPINYFNDPCRGRQSTSLPAKRTIRITSLSPSSGKPGAWVILNGEALNRRRLFLRFGDKVTPASHLPDGKRIKFRVPQRAPGTYSVRVETAGETSNTLTFTVR